MRVPVGQLGVRIAQDVRRKLRRHRVDRVLVSNARRRISNRGDSEHRYPDLWNHPGSYRRGGQPLRDTGRLSSSLTSTISDTPRGVTLTLVSPLPYAQAHQEGFETSGPNFIPLTQKAKRRHRKGADPAEEGLVRGVDYVMAWNGVSVPQRKIYNMPSEDVEDLREAITTAIGSP